MNIAVEPWIPCTYTDGTSKMVSLVQCFDDPNIVDLAVRPHERVSLMRLLLCIAYAALGVPKDYMVWESYREKLSASCVQYLQNWQGSFELFHPKQPFLQVSSLSSDAKRKGAATENDAGEGGVTSTAKLDFALASGNNSTLFDHEALNPDRSPSLEKLVLDLLTFQMFSLGGRIGKVSWNAIQMYKKEERNSASVSSIDAPCSPSSMLHTFVRGENLVETVWQNILSVDMLHGYEKLSPQSGDWCGRPIWEKFPQGPDDVDAVENATKTFVGRLVPLSRSILLNKDGKTMLLGNGLQYPSFTNPNNPFPPEPSATTVLRHVKKDVTERVLLGVTLGKDLWRELHAITAQQQSDGPGGCLALSRFSLMNERSVDIVVAGMARDKARTIDVVESVFHIPSHMFCIEGHELYALEVKKAEEIESILSSAIEHWRTAIDGGWKTRLQLAGGKKREELAKLRAQASRDYWTYVERNLQLLWSSLKYLGSEDAPKYLLSWRKMLRVSVLEAYNSACKGDDQRHMRAYVLGKKILLSRTKKLLEEED